MLCFSRGVFLKDMAIGAVTGGLASVSFYGAGKAVDALKGSVSGGSKKTTNTFKTNFYVKPDGNIVPAIGYRYTARNVSAIQNAQSGRIVARSEGMYFSFDKMDDAIIAQGKLQIPYRPEYRIEFDTLDIIDDISIPKGNWGRADYLEPITKDFGKYGPGKATQVITYSEIDSVNGVYKMR